MKAQWVLYNQFGHRYIQPDVTHVFFIVTTNTIIGPNAHPLNFHPASLVTTYAAGKIFLQELQARGISTEWIISADFRSGIEIFLEKTGIREVCVMDPSENYIRKKIIRLQRFFQEKFLSFIIFENQEFIFSVSEIQKHFSKPPLFEYFYRWARKKTGILMENTSPVGGKWNFDHENRKFDKKREPLKRDFVFERTDYSKAALEEARNFYEYSGEIIAPLSASEAQQLLGDFLLHHIEKFGPLEDAMYQEDDFVHHSLLSTSINLGLISPFQIIHAVEASNAPISSKEGCIRQILGWREYIHYFYEFYKDDIHSVNFFGHTHILPKYFWGNQYGEEMPQEIQKMNCISTVLRRVDRTGYSHHIERLMVLGNFMLLCGIHPHEVNTWFFERYIDAFEWVVSPNVIAMSQFADGGRLASKPYICSANYINTMSDFCKNCQFDPKEKYGETACPMNSLYWVFIHENKATFENGRQSFVTNQVSKIDIPALQRQKELFLKKAKILQ